MKQSGLPTGVYRNGRGYRAQISIDDTNVCLGTFRTVKEAEKAYQQAKATKHQYISSTNTMADR